MATGVITYTKTEADELRAIQPSAKVFAAPNSLYRAQQCAFINAQDRTAIMYVGRLVDSKKPELLLRAFEQVHEVLPSVGLKIVGSGPLEPHLRRIAKGIDDDGSISFLGHEDSYERLKALYSNSFVSASPGYAGLSLIQSLSFGVPAVIANKEPHAPEIEAAFPGRNCYFFRSNDPEDLARQILRVYNERDHWEAAGPRIAQSTAATYSVEQMAAGILQAVRNCL